jgi:hypothetical protein
MLMDRKASWFWQFIFVFLSNFSLAQTGTSCHLQISVLTCSPGDELYSLFGHSAIRIYDSTNRTDIIYNWGTFDFDEPDFYTKFMRGKLLYFVSPDQLPDFLYIYQYEGRSVTEQILNLSCDERKQIKHSVDSNMQGNNRFYKYDFLFDNCTTRIRDLIFNNVKGLHISGNIVPPGTTFRNMLYSYLDKGGQPWSKLGIDILLGAKIDKPVTSWQAMFLPEYLMKAFDSSQTNNKSIVDQRKLVLPQKNDGNISGVYIPLIVISIICTLIFLISILKAPWARSITKITDSLLLYITGVIGLLILFMWFFTDHVACADNYNLIWTIPTNVIIGFLVWRKPLWTKKYFLVLAVLTALSLLSWFWLPQQLNIALIPVLLLLLYRYIRLSTEQNISAETLKRFEHDAKKVPL